MNTPTRLRIIDYLKKQHAASAKDLGLALGMTRANIRHHLVVLENNELVEVIGQHKEGRGRPKNIYGISHRMLGDGLEELSSALLCEWLGDVPEEIQIAKLESLAARLGKGFAGTGTTPLPKKLTELVRSLNRLHYQARWEAGAMGARIVLGHCPFSAIIDSHPELCRVDALLLEKSMTGQHVEQAVKLEKIGQGLPQCIFTIG